MQKRLQIIAGDRTHWVRRPTLWLILGLLTLAPGCRDREAPANTKTSHETEATDGQASSRDFAPGSIRLVDVTERTGITFQHRSGEQGNFTYPEIMSGGVCLADFDGDADLDLYFPQSSLVPGDEGQAQPNVLYLNDGKGKFQDVSATSGADVAGYGMGAFAADVDDDGDLDLLLTSVGSLRLLENDGRAQFKDITSASGIPTTNGFWLNAAVADLDGDGALDIYVANYTNWHSGSDPDCSAPGGGKDYCNPSVYPGATDLVLFGRGDGTFEDATQASGIGNAATHSMGVVTLDVDRDGDLDIYVANDGQPNLLWMNQGSREFKDEAMIRGAAVNNAGAPEASMGIACADFDADGDEDLIMTHLSNETHTYYRNDNGYFTDVTATSGLAAWSRNDTGFGISAVDFDNDGQLDLFIANGRVGRPTSPVDPNQPYAQTNRIARGQQGRFPSAIEFLDPKSSQPKLNVGRGVAHGDWNGDGLIDIVAVVKDGPVQLLENQTQDAGHWIALRPIAREGGSAVISATVQLETLPDLGISVVRPHASYLGNHEGLVRFGLAGRDTPVTAIVSWPDGSTDRFPDLAINQFHQLVRGTGQNAGEVPMAAPQYRTSQAVVVADRGTSSGEALSPSTVSVAEKPLGPIPPLSFRKSGPRSKRAVIDDGLLAEWCRQANLPPPPESAALDAPTWVLVHPAIEAAGRKADAETLGALAMFYDGHYVIESAIELYERLVKLQPQEARWWHLLGRACSDTGRTERAVAAFLKAVALAPREPAGYARLGEAQLAAGLNQAALETWQKYAELRPQDPLGHVGVARAAEMLEDYPRAMRAAEQALRIQPRARPALILAARVAARSNDTATAESYQARAAALSKADDLLLLDDVDRAMREHARSIAYLRAATNFFKQKGRYAEAMKTALLLTERRPDEAQNWKMLLLLSTVLKQPDRAARYAKVVTELEPTFSPAWETLAKQRLGAGQAKQALDAAEMALQGQPLLPPAYLTHGRALCALQRWEEALQSLNKGLSGNSNDVDGLVAKATALFRLGQRDAAEKALQLALRLNPAHAQARQLRTELRDSK